MPSISERGRRSHVRWQTLFARAEHSDLSVTEFCHRKSVSTASVYNWRNRLRAVGEPQCPSVAADRVDPGVLAEDKDGIAPWRIELDPGAGMVLRLRRG